MAELTTTTETAAPNRLDAASKIISSSIGWSAATGAIPVPLLDLAALAAVQANMISRIAGLYGETLGSESARAIVSIMLGTLLPAGGASGLMRVGIKAFPGAGYLIGTASMMALSAAGTYAVGKVFVSHFEKGGTLASFKPEAIKAQLQKEFEDAKSQDAKSQGAKSAA
ncbi:MAG TPA: DUF697 domain-containing protein [Magnetospirillum sp.]|nr:DUF697 domain-containing protein [Magnetospirillum sp.]